MKKTALLLCVFVLLSVCQVFAQTLQVTGRVLSSANSEPLAGASVSVKGTNMATTTDAQGNYSISVPKAGSTLVVSYTGMESQERTIRAAGNQDFSVVSTNNTLNEVVVNVGYGSQKKSVTTGAISSVRAKDLENVPNGRLEQTLQGRVSGVLIGQNAGQPGSASTVRVRGVTTFGDNNPLYVIDGIVVDPGAIGYLNQSDIESIEVLKDATSAAIYGTRAATGVILVTTKKGRGGKISVSYNTFYGTSRAAKKLDLLNATEYATLINERLVGGGGSPKYADPTIFGQGTDWQDQIFENNAKRSNHELSISGGNDKSTFYASFGLQDQEGIVAPEISHYNKKTFRLNSTHKIGKYVTFGQTFGYTHQNSRGVGNTNSEFGGPLSSAINLDPITPVIVTDPAVLATAPYNNPALQLIRNAQGYPYGISNNVGQEMSNPKAYILTRLGNYNWSDDFIGNAYVEVKPTSKITLRSTFGGKIAYWGDYGFNPSFYLSATIVNSVNSIGKGTNNTFNWNIENTVQYADKIGDHDFSVLLGQGAYVDNNGGGQGIGIKDLPVNDYQQASFNFATTADKVTAGASDFVVHKVASLFGRVNYNFQEKYLFTGILRRDGSTRFGSNNKYGVFPSGSLGWVLSKENFWTANKYVNSLKLRGGYGKVGNDQIGNFRYLSTVVGGFNYTVGGAINGGYAPLTLDNPDLAWEETTQANFGFDAQIFNNFSLTMEIFNKKTSGILREVQIPGYVGVAASPSANIADMENKGLEVELGWRQKYANGLSLGANGNVSFLKNKVTFINTDAPFIGGDASFQSMGNVTRTQVGQSYNSFFGYKTNGIFQNQADIDNYKDKNGGVIQPGARPGDFRWVDTNGDGSITEADRVFLGTNIPKVTFGATVTAAWKGFDLMVFAQGAAGNKIFQGLRRLDVAEGNWQTKALGRWTGEGTSNTYPRLTNDDTNGNFTKMSDFYLEKGDYIRLKVVQIGYTYTNKTLSKLGLTKLRLYLTGENLATLTDYTGYDPEIGGGVFGVDKGFYPQARSFIVGAQITF
ncbi:TonB-dependent receptor [Ferruginibacter sp. HRS2-29]|uniref:SusC/RagA family TonB-linked outer membrane protein n=1 Tax=Ferruginibacter sp. HRS2-29 TaxID=2487334 RepID=UPI0020CB9C71|nr:TonB-dependent receptor [Ferruginibacter sp. HRS2-29]MCP9749649.1 TonB-dependent receptor [Ferruginibacter sp. HRS2-29]